MRGSFLPDIFSHYLAYYSFKGLTIQEVSALKKLFIGNLPASTSEEDLQIMLSEFGTVRSTKLVMDVFSGDCKGFGFAEMEGHEARAAITGLNGKDFKGRPIKVNFESPRVKGKRR